MPVRARSIPELSRRWLDRERLVKVDRADPPERIDHNASLRRQLRLVGHVLEITTAVNSCHWAWRRDASRPRFEHLIDDTAPGFSPKSRQPGADLLAFDTAGDEVGYTGPMRQTVPAPNDPFDRRFRILCWRDFFDCL